MAPGAWAFDVDGCLVDVLSARTPRPLGAELVAFLRRRGVPVVAWSAGGADYARTVLERTGLASGVGAYFTKERINGFWSLDVFAPVGIPAVFVDDDVSGLPHGVRAIAVPPYIGGSPHDAALRRVLDLALEDHG